MDLGSGSLWMWGGFLGVVVVMLAIDLGLFHRKAHEVTARESATTELVFGVEVMVPHPLSPCSN